MNNEQSKLFPPEYLCLVNNLIERRDNAKTLIELKRVFTDFAKHHTPVTYLFKAWEKVAAIFKDEKYFSKYQQDMNNLFKGYFENIKLYNTVVVSQKIDIIMRHNSGCCCYSNPDDPLRIFCRIEAWKGLDVYRENVENFKKLIQIPHRNMEFTLKELDEFSEFPIDASMLKKYEKARELHQKMIEADEALDHEKWFKYLLESNDQKCIERNALYRISKYPFVEKLWKLYLEYLETTNLKMMLKLYGRYCRLFINDKDMLERYRKELQKYGNQGICVTKFWIDTIEFERIFVSAKSAGKVLSQALRSCTIGPKGLILYAKRFYKNNPKCIKLRNIKKGSKNLMEFDFQSRKNNFNLIKGAVEEMDFSESIEVLFLLNEHGKVHRINGNLPINLIFNIIKKSSIELLLKLFQTCKYYNKILRRLTCHHLHINDENEFKMYGQALFLPTLNISLNFEAIFLTNNLNIGSKKNPRLLSELLPKFTSYNIRYLVIYDQNFTFKEYKLLTKFGNIENLCLDGVNIFDENGSVITAIEKILSLVPKAYQIDLMILPTITCDPDLSLSSHHCKIKLLFIGFVYKSFNVQYFCEFITKYCDPGADILVISKEEDDCKLQFLLLKTWKNFCKLNETFNNVHFSTGSGTESEDTFLTIEDVENDDIL